MIRMPEQFLPYTAFGWETETRLAAGIEQCRGNFDCAYESDYEKSVPFQNWIKVAAYLPVINVIIGIARICIASAFINEFNKNVPRTEAEVIELEITRFVFAMHVVRGIAEIFTGPLLGLIDAVKTLYDYVIAKQFLEEQAARAADF